MILESLLFPSHSPELVAGSVLLFEARNIRVLSNLFEGSSAPVAFVGCVDSIVATNTLIEPELWIFRILQESVSYGKYEFLPCGDNRFENNLAYFDRSQIRRHVNIGTDTDPASFLYANNLWFAYDNPANSKPDLIAEEDDGIYGEDPQLFDPSGGDFRIGPDSPAAGAGLSPALLEGDLAGKCYRLPPSIGAYEYVVPCQGDSEPDGDVDGWDMWNWMTTTDQSASNLPELATHFGRTDCILPKVWSH